MQTRKEFSTQSGTTVKTFVCSEDDQLVNLNQFAIERQSLMAIYDLLHVTDNRQWIDTVDEIFFDWVSYYEFIDPESASSMANYIRNLKKFFRALDGLNIFEINKRLDSFYNLQPESHD